MPRGWKPAMPAPMSPTASTPKYIPLAGSPSLPMMPTPRLNQARRIAAASAMLAAGSAGGSHGFAMYFIKQSLSTAPAATGPGSHGYRVISEKQSL